MLVCRRQLLRGAGLAALACVAPPIAGCRKPKTRLVVGFSQMANIGAWRIAETNSIRTEAERRGARYELVVTDAQDQTAKQISDIEDLIARRADAIFLAPREYDGLEPALEGAKRAKIPVLLIDREAEGEAGSDYVSFLGSNFVEQGRRAAEWLVRKVGGKAGVFELTGTPGSSVARDRSQGFRDVLGAQHGMKLVGAQTGEFVRASALRVMENVLQAYRSEITAVYAHNDEMALGAIQALKGAGLRPGQDVTVVSIDGQRLALEAIVRGELGASVESNPRFGPLAFDTLERFLGGQAVPSKIVLEDRLFDASNASEFLNDAY